MFHNFIYFKSIVHCQCFFILYTGTIHPMCYLTFFRVHLLNTVLVFWSCYPGIVKLWENRWTSFTSMRQEETEAQSSRDFLWAHSWWIYLGTFGCTLKRTVIRLSHLPLWTEVCMWTSPPVMSGKNCNVYSAVSDIYVTPQKGSSSGLDSMENFWSHSQSRSLGRR